MTGPVLCAVDISDTKADVSVLQAAYRLAERDGLGLDVVTVVPDFGTSIVGSFFQRDHHDKMVDAAKVELGKIVTDAIGAEANETVRHIVATGTVYEEVLKLAGKAQTSIIVIGAHKPDFKDYLLGPNAARVVRHSSCSVFVVR